MKEGQTAPEKIIVIDIKLTRGLVVALSCVLVLALLLTYLALAGEGASASETDAALAAWTAMRQFYLSETPAVGDGALTACAAGYHMASLWEIADPSNLAYNITLGSKRDDSGQGPPVAQEGWVRTGYDSSSSTVHGRGNCEAWTSHSDTVYGTRVMLHSDWAYDVEDIGVWSTANDKCSIAFPVWCVED